MNSPAPAAKVKIRMITEPDPTSERVARNTKRQRFYGILYALFAVGFLVLGIHSIVASANSWYGYLEVVSAAIWSWCAWQSVKQASTT